MATRSSSNNERSGELPPRVVDDLLSAPHRRLALEILQDRDEPVVVSELATAILATERGTAPSGIPKSDRDELCRELYTKHLPKLTATGVVTYDSMTERVELCRPAILD